MKIFLWAIGWLRNTWWARLTPKRYLQEIRKKVINNIRTSKIIRGDDPFPGNKGERARKSRDSMIEKEQKPKK